MLPEYDFQEQLRMSSGYAASADICNILMEQIPGACSVRPAAKVNDKQGVDWWVELSSCRHLAVDAKVRGKDWLASHPDQDDLALESWSVCENVVGWTRDPNKRCDYVLWLWQDTGRFCLVPFPMLCKVFSDNWQTWRGVYKTRRQVTRRLNDTSYESECVFVPRRHLWGQIYKQFSGQLAA